MAPKSSLVLPLKMAPNFEAVVLLQICGQICRGMPYPFFFFVEEVVPLLGKMSDKLVLTCLWSEFEHKQ